MIPTNLRYSLLIAIIIYFLIILILLKNRSLSLKYTLLWLLAGMVMLFSVIFPDVLFSVTRFFGIVSNMNGLYIVCIGFIIMILMALTSIVSKQTGKIKRLTQEIAILEKKVREIESKQENVEHVDSFTHTDDF